MFSIRTRVVALATLALLTVCRPALAQNLGTFRWQLQPFCNVVTVNVTQNGAVYTLDGYDDQCGAPTRAPLVGLATPNPDGTIGFGFHLVTTPAATPVAVRASISLATVGGAWSDSAGNSGTLVLNGAGTGSPRPGAVATFPAGLAAGGARVTNVGTPTQPGDAATKGYVDGGDAATRAYVDGAVPPPAFTFQTDGGLVARGELGVGAIPASGIGHRLMWYPARGAFRAGIAEGTESDAANLGTGSFAAGRSVRASAPSASALGYFTVAGGDGSLAAGWKSWATGITARRSATKWVLVT